MVYFLWAASQITRTTGFVPGSCYFVAYWAASQSRGTAGLRLAFLSKFLSLASDLFFPFIAELHFNSLFHFSRPRFTKLGFLVSPFFGLTVCSVGDCLWAPALVVFFRPTLSPVRSDLVAIITGGEIACRYPCSVAPGSPIPHPYT